MPSRGRLPERPERVPFLVKVHFLSCSFRRIYLAHPRPAGPIILANPIALVASRLIRPRAGTMAQASRLMDSPFSRGVGTIIERRGRVSGTTVGMSISAPLGLACS